KLPAYMVPQHVVLLEAMPLTPNGKIDRRALPEPTIGIAGTSTAEDGAAEDDAVLTDEIEQTLAVLWQEVLDVGRIGPEDNFFRLGGHSLKAIALLARMKKAFGVSLPIQKLFRAPTVRQLAGLIREAPKQRFVPIPRADPQQAYYRLSSQQERLYVLQQFEAIGTAYHVTWAAQVQGPFDPVRCEAAFAAVSLRHEALRTCFEMTGDTVVQHVLPQATGFFEYEEVPGGDHRSLIGPFVRPFELRTGPLFRVKVVRTGREEHLLLLDMHHMITDGVSQDIVLKEFTALYEGEVLEPLRMQYKDYAIWQSVQSRQNRQSVQSGQRGTLREQGRYWLELFQGELPVLDLPADYPRPVVQSFEGDKLSVRLDAERSAEVKKLAEATDTTLFIVLLAAYDVLLHKYTGQEDIIVGSPFAGRRHAELESMVGMFVNTVALRSFPQRDKTVRSFLAEVKESCLKAYEHQEFSFEQLIEQLQLPRDFSRNPLFDTMFVLQNMEGYTPDLKNVQMTAYPVNNGIAKFDLTLEAAEEKDGSLRLSLEYCTKLFRRDTVERFLQHYMNIVQHLAGNLDRRLSEIEMLSGAERERLVQG
ncbi:condensation domain-containing protein, partial [Paenibacillus graminis]|uniref:condensation domain-containing protein n=1 Tax=Paenibacillus graminis TaxID=189425 RepID=UPI002DBD15A4